MNGPHTQQQAHPQNTHTNSISHILKIKSNSNESVEIRDFSPCDCLEFMTATEAYNNQAIILIN